jgi:filamentous hemagglutinin family protein
MTFAGVRPSRVVLAWALSASAAAALPVGGVVVGATPAPGGGPGAIVTETTTALTVDQAADRVVLDWRSFNIGESEAVRFNQPGAGSVAFNRVAPGALTTIDGALTANGSVWLFSPGGLLFGANARVSAAQFVAGAGVFGDREIGSALSGGRLNLGPSGGGVSVARGAEIAGGAGGVLLQGKVIDQNGRVSATGDVGYLVSDGGGVATREPSRRRRLMRRPAPGSSTEGRREPAACRWRFKPARPAEPRSSTSTAWSRRPECSPRVGRAC